MHFFIYLSVRSVKHLCFTGRKKYLPSRYQLKIIHNSNIDFFIVTHPVRNDFARPQEKPNWLYYCKKPKNVIFFSHLKLLLLEKFLIV